MGPSAGLGPPPADGPRAAKPRGPRAAMARVGSRSPPLCPRRGAQRHGWALFCFFLLPPPPPPTPPPCPGCRRQEGTREPGSPSLGLRSLGETREGRSPCGGDTPPRNVVKTYRSHRTFLPVVLPGAGSRPGRRHPFLDTPSKGSNRRRPRFPRPLLPAASGAACGARVMGALHNSRRPCRCAPRRGHRGWEREPTRAVAALGPGLCAAFEHAA